MKKFVCMMIALTLALATTAVLAALAEPATYTDRANDFTFTYDTGAFEITLEEYQSDEDDDLVLVLGGREEAWGNVFIQMNRVAIDFEDAETVEAYNAAEEQLIAGAGAVKTEWNGFSDVLMYAFEDDECTEQTFVVPADGETLSIMIHTDNIEDEDAAMSRDDQISAVLDSLAFLPDGQN